MKRQREDEEPAVECQPLLSCPALGQDRLVHAVRQRFQHLEGVDNVELEIRLCRFEQKDRRERVRLQIDSPAIITAPHITQVGIEERFFKALLDGVKQESADGGWTASSTSSTSHSYDNGLRIIHHVDGKKEYMTKKKISTVDILVPRSPYDIRIGLAMEVAQAEATPPDTKPFVRIRHRNTFTQEREAGSGTPMSIDLTKVEGVDGGASTYEVEAEMVFERFTNNYNDIEKLLHFAFSCIDKIRVARSEPQRGNRN